MANLHYLLNDLSSLVSFSVFTHLLIPRSIACFMTFDGGLHEMLCYELLALHIGYLMEVYMSRCPVNGFGRLSFTGLSDLW